LGEDSSVTGIDEAAFRKEMRDFIRSVLPDSLREKVRAGLRASPDELRQWHRILDAHGRVAPAWPVEYGGTGWDPIRLHIFREELQLCYAPPPLTMNINLVGPVIIAFGSDEQKERFLPGVRSLDLWFGQGFSEPNAGSDLAALRTSAVQDGDDYIVNGQKTWTTYAQHSNWMFALVRTSSSGRKQDGITYLLIDMASPGITVRPIVTLDHDHHVNEVFFDNVRVPVANRIGEENKAWSYAKYLLTHERVGGARTGIPMARIRRARELARGIIVDGRPLAEDVAFRLKIAAVEVELKALEVTYMRILGEMMRHPSAGLDPKSSILKLRGTELMQRTDEILFEMAGEEGLRLLDEPMDGPLDPEFGEETWMFAAGRNYFYDRAQTIFAGTSEVQRGILAKQVLGL
jgi:alkylation response protein AidB-like acyl-CoA dehydrogenase